MQAKITIDGGEVTSSVVAGSVSKDSNTDLMDFYQALSVIAHLDTGILPLDGTGVLAIRKALNHTQITMQVAAGVYRVMWGARERDPNVKTFMLAQPYHIMIGDISDGNFLGARHFYSPIPVTSPDARLYHVNLPNLNCRGYNGTGVGWVCLYHSTGRSAWKDLTLGGQARALQMRVCSEEAFNDANMHRTDGPRFYAAAKKPKYFWDPATWEKKTKAEGFEWTCDEDLLIPIKVKGVDDQAAHDDAGVPLTLGMAMAGKYNAYYRDPWNDDNKNKPVNAIARGDKKSLTSDDITSWMYKAATTPIQLSKPTVDVAKIPADITQQVHVEIQKIQCGSCQKKKPGTDEKGKSVFTKTKLGQTCLDCMSSGAFFTCTHCKAINHFANGIAFEEKLYCQGHFVLAECQKCHKRYKSVEMILPGGGCKECTVLEKCSLCNGDFDKESLVEHSTIDPTDTTKKMDLKLCKGCAGKSTYCQCGFLREAGMLYAADNAQHPVCQTCVAFSGDQIPFYNVMTALNPDVEVILKPKAVKMTATAK